MRVAIIDCGTNTFNLLILETKNHKNYSKLVSNRISVRLGEDTINKGYISKTAIERGILALQNFNLDLKNYNVEKTLAFATSAIRDASNGLDFIKNIKLITDIDITVIDGNKEAELIYLGVKHAVKLTKKPSLLMDIGGGSVEFIIANKDEIFWKRSFNTGVARLKEFLKFSNPITNLEEEALIDTFKINFIELTTAINIHQPCELIGASGAFDSIIEMIHGELSGEPLIEDNTEYEVNYHTYFFILNKILTSTELLRANTKGLISMRQDMIVISCVMMNYVLNLLNTKKFRVSTYSLKEGAFFNFTNC
jgi:exopolyphosphatase / guanosine-5'-triphosphate,3'-diphosphate pyrophosphatase